MVHGGQSIVTLGDKRASTKSGIIRLALGLAVLTRLRFLAEDGYFIFAAISLLSQGLNDWVRYVFPFACQ